MNGVHVGNEGVRRRRRRSRSRRTEEAEEEEGKRKEKEKEKEYIPHCTAIYVETIDSWGIM